MNNLPSILGGLAQGFVDFGKSAVDLFGTGGAAIGDLIQGTGTKNQDDFRKWLYQTDDTKDATAKGLGTALNGAQTVLDYIPGIGAVTKNPLFNAGQGALGGLADEFKTYGKDYDLGRAGQRAAISAGGALVSSGLADALKKSANPLLSSGAVQGLARGATGGAISGGGYAAIDGDDIYNSTLQGAGMGALIGGATGLAQDFKPAKTYDVALTDEEKAARIAKAKNMLANEQNPERIAELNAQIRKYGGDSQDTIKLYRGMSAPDDATLNQYIDEMLDPNVAPTTHSGGSAYGQGYYFTPDEGLARYYANEPGLPSTAVMEIEVPRNRFTEISKEKGNRPADFDLAAVKRGVPEDIRYETGVKDFNNYLDSNGYWGSMTGDNGTYTIMRNDALANARRVSDLGSTLAASENAINNPRYLVDEQGNPRTFYHGSPETNITEFDMSKAGRNTRSGEHAFYFTDSPEVADEFSYERIPTDSMFIDKVGKKGKVYPANLSMNNPLDLDNLSDAQIRELWEYASPMGKLNGEEGFIRDMTNFRDKYHNAQGAKLMLDIDKLQDSPYDGFMATMYPNQANKAREYAVFSNDNIKLLEGVLADYDKFINDAPEVMASKVAPGQLDLFNDYTPKPKTEPTIDGLDYYGDDIRMIEPDAPANPYAPVNGQVTQAMRDRAADIMKNYKKKGVPANDLYDAINPETVPEKVQFIKDISDNGVYKNKLKELFGTDDIKKADIKQVIDYIYENEPARAELIKNRFAQERGIDSYEKKFRNRIKNGVYEAAERRIADELGLDKNLASKGISNLSVREGYTAAADEALSERLGIAPGNTPKYNGAMDVRNAYGRYSHPTLSEGGDLAVFERKMQNPEDAVSSIAHERLHAFQGEADSRNKNRYNQEVIDAYKDLQKDLSKHYRSWDETAQRYGRRDAGYWQRADEQEARMLQTYLENKGYAQAPHRNNKYNKGEWGNEINPAFDKFFDKLRDLSKRGVALPAIAALFGGGAYMASQDKDKKEAK